MMMMFIFVGVHVSVHCMMVRVPQAVHCGEQMWLESDGSIGLWEERSGGRGDWRYMVRSPPCLSLHVGIMSASPHEIRSLSVHVGIMSASPHEIHRIGGGCPC